MYAIVQTGAKQYKVKEGDTLFIEKLDESVGSTFLFDNVLLVSNEGDLMVGTPFVSGTSVSAKVLKNGKAEKIIIFKYKSKKNYRRKQGHRQAYTQVQIEKIKA